MDDLISRKAVLDMLNCAYSAWCTDDVRKAIEKISIAVDDLPSVQAEQRWIPCNWQTKEENLPQECRSVLICVKYSFGYRVGVSYRTDYNRWEGFGRVNVIAWMPLPEPYREDGEADDKG